MKNTTLLTYLLCCLLFNCILGSQIDVQADFWHTIHEVKRNWSEFEVEKPLGPCQPCQYRIQLYKQDLVFHVVNSKSPQQVYSCSFELPSVNQVNFVGRSYQMVHNCPHPLGKSQIKISREAKNGLIWNYQISVFDLGLFIKVSEIQYTNLLMLMCIFFNGVSMVLFPLSQNQIKYFQQQLYGRISFVSLVLYTQLLMTIIGYQLILFISYMYYQESYISKIQSYMLIGICFLFTAIHLGYCFGVLQKKIDDFLPRNDGIKCIFTFLLFFMGIVIYPFVICFFPKGIWFFFYSSIGIYYQYYYSIKNSVYPYGKFIILFMLNILFMAFFACLYPFANFIQLTPFNLVILVVYEGILFAVGSFCMQNRIKVQRGMTEGEGSGYNHKQLDVVGSTEIKSEEIVK